MHCPASDECIREEDVCNFVVTCRDNSDEEECLMLHPNEVEMGTAMVFKPMNGPIYAPGRKLVFLNHIKQFNFTLLEGGIPCPGSHFECQFSHHCMPVYLRCNGKRSKI